MDATRISKREEIARLLAEGLDHYGEDAIGKAIQSWRAVLDLDPHNPEALDYIQTADRREQRKLPREDQMSDTARRVVHEAGVRIETGDWEGALDLLRSVGDSEASGLEYEATIEIVRSRLLGCYAERIGDLDALPVVCGKGDLRSFNLPRDAGFVLSLIDGDTRLSDLISLSGMDAFEALRVVGHLLDAGIVEMRV